MRWRTIGASVLLATLTAVSVGAGTMVEGVLTAVHDATVTIDGTRFVITDETVCEDQVGARIALVELQPGTRVSAEIGDDGGLALLKADLLR